MREQKSERNTRKTKRKFVVGFKTTQTIHIHIHIHLINYENKFAKSDRRICVLSFLFHFFFFNKF